MRCAIASDSNLSTNLYHLVVRQFEDIGDANRIPSHRSKDSFLPAWDTSVTLAWYDSLVTDVKSDIVAVHFDALCPAVVEYG
jgi:hypothetical protein